MIHVYPEKLKLPQKAASFSSNPQALYAMQL